MAKTSFTPQKLKTLLIGLFVLLVLGLGGLFYLSLNEFKDYALKVNHRTQDAEASAQQVQQLQSLKGQIADSQQLIAKANQLFSTPENYQTQALTDIRAIAATSGVSISGTEFNDSDNPNGQKIMTVKLASPVSYKKIIAFFHGIEGNIPKMQVSSATLSHVSGGNSDSVSVEEIKIKLTVR